MRFRRLTIGVPSWVVASNKLYRALTPAQRAVLQEVKLELMDELFNSFPLTAGTLKNFEAVSRRIANGA